MNPMMPPEEGEMPTTGDYTIEIKVKGGAISVSVEPMGEEPPEEDGQPVPNIREAIKVVMDIYQNAGTQTDTIAADQEMEQGFKPGL